MAVSRSAGPAPGPLDRLLADPRHRDSITHVERIAARPGTSAAWPSWTAPTLLAAYQQRGVREPWTHQAAAAEMAYGGQHVTIATGTGSGKSLAYLLPALTTLGGDDRARALYLAPTKALAMDQLAAMQDLLPTGVRAATFDGDTAMTERDWVRKHAAYVLTNPDMLHRGILPRHSDWAMFLRGLRYVILDEAHVYRGVFGSHVAAVLRRLRRLCARYGADPTFVVASATMADPALAAGRLTGLELAAVVEDASPRGALDVVLWSPPMSDLTGEHGAPIRRSAVAESADLLTDLVVDGVRTLAFVRSRRGAETVAAMVRDSLAEVSHELSGRVAAYRGGYLPEERRALESALRSGELLGVASTNALELGVDVSGLDAVLVVGFPGTLASLWQQVGRAGREGQRAGAVFVAREDPLDTYLAHNPEAVFGRPVETTVLDPGNPHVLAPHLQLAAAELPLTLDDLVSFGPTAQGVVDDLVAGGSLRRRPTGWYWTQLARPDVDIRGGGGRPVRLVEVGTGRLLGTVDSGSAHGQAFPGAVYTHQGVTYLVESLDLDEGVALIARAEPDFSTWARDVTDIRLLGELASWQGGGLRLSLGEVEVTNHVVSFLRKRLRTGEVLAEVPLDLPPRQLRTKAVLYVVGEELLAEAAVEWPDVPGAAHAAEHAAIGLLPLFASCDRWDIGGVSTPVHADTGGTTVFVYDGYPGGAGFAERGFHRALPWLEATRAAVVACECPVGCPSCVQSPKCGNGNEPLDKAGAARLLTAVTARLASTH